MTIGPPSVVTACADATDAIMAIMDAAFDTGYGETWSAGQVRSALCMPHCHGLLYSDPAQSNPVGFLIYRIVATESEMLMLATMPAMRGKGYAHALMAHWQQAAQCAGVDTLFLEVRDTNPAIALYQHYGFQSVGIRKSYYRGSDGIACDAQTMRKTIFT